AEVADLEAIVTDSSLPDYAVADLTAAGPKVVLA
ncbi:MAG: hypothetical protein QG597_3187, partial [Actinomycetota bacterium]|nr:hypothetical protein [Actinomycetota bacterium]